MHRLRACALCFVVASAALFGCAERKVLDVEVLDAEPDVDVREARRGTRPPGDATPAPHHSADDHAARAPETDPLTVLVLLREAGLLERAGASPTTTLRALPEADRLSALAGARDALSAQLAPAGITITHAYRNFPVVVARLPEPSAAAVVRSHPLVAGVDPNFIVRATDTESFALIRQPEVVAKGLTGTGAAVAVLDTGLDYTRTAFGACTAPGVPASCRVPVSVDIAPEDYELDDPTSLHGSNVAGIVAGVAPGAMVIGLDVFSGQYATYEYIMNAVDWVIDNQQIHAIAAMNLSLGTSTRYSTVCGQFAASEAAFLEARNTGVVVTVASGNNGDSSGITWPACLPSAVSVGAVYKMNYSGMNFGVCQDTNIVADQVTCFSNSASFLDILAPGALISAAGITMGGTSQAAPHVAGAIAVLSSAFPALSATEVIDQLVATGASVVDRRNSLTFPRLDLAAAVAAGTVVGSVPPLPALGGTVDVEVFSADTWTASTSATWLSVVGEASATGDATLTLSAAPNTGASARTATLRIEGQFFGGVTTATVQQLADTTAPTGTVVINSGAPWTKELTVTLDIDASDVSGVSAMCLTGSTSCTSFVPFNETAPFTLPSGSGSKTVTVWLRDGLGNATTSSTSPKATIGLDQTAPTNGSVAFQTAGGTRSVTWSGFSDAGSGVDRYTVAAKLGVTPPASCAAGAADQVTDVGTATAFTDLSVAGESTFSYRVCALDGVGNMSSGAALVGVPLPEATPPTGSIVVQDGAAFTTSRTVTVTVTAQDISQVTHMCLSSSNTCTAYVAFAASTSFTLPAAAGTHSVNVWLKDQWGNAMVSPVSAQIALDLAAPSNGLVEATGGNAMNTLSWSGFSDDASGVVLYRVMAAAAATAPTTCTSGTPVYAGSSLSFTHTGLTNGTRYSYRVCAVDAANRVSTGATVTSSPRLESDPPVVGSMVVNGGAAATRTTAVTVVFSSLSEQSAMGGVCLSEATTCTSWQAWATTKAFTLTSGAGTKTVRAWFRDQWGNTTSEPKTATIILDTTAPTGGVLEATVASGQSTLTWRDFSDAGSSVASYRLVSAASTTAPSSCAAGTLAYAGTETSFVHSGLVNGTTYSWRVCAVDAAGNMSAGKTVTAKVKPENTGPVGTLSIQGGAEFTRSRATTLGLAADDPSGVTHMCVSSAVTCASWVVFRASMAFTLSAGPGQKTVNAWFRDRWGNVSAPVSDTIVLDSGAPVQGTLAARGEPSSARLTMAGFSDATTSVVAYRIARATGTRPPSSCTAASAALSTVSASAPGTDTVHVVSGLTDGTTYAFRVCAEDAAGNVSAGVTATATPIPEGVPPVGSVSITQGDYTRTTAVTLALSATDDSPGIEMCVSSATTCTSWVAYATSRSFTLPSGSGPKTVRVWFRDKWRNTTATPASDTIILDSTPPTNGTLQATAAPLAAALSWSGFSDIPGPVVGYRVAHAASTAPSSCAQGTVVELGAVSATTIAGLAAGQARGFRVCAVDAAGNVSSGVTKMVTPLGNVCGDGVKAGSEACDDHNTTGGDGCSAVCAQETGYSCTGQGAGSCVDVNECLTDNGGCSPYATCTNLIGARSCACSAGFSGDGLVCSDIDECATANGGCSPYATCTNTAGSRTCACDEGFVGDGLSCTCAPGTQDNDADGTCMPDCATEELLCGTNTQCDDGTGVAVCSCATGHQDLDGDGDCAPAPSTTGRVLVLIANNGFFYQEYEDPRFELERAGLDVVVASGAGSTAVPHPESYDNRYNDREVTVGPVNETVPLREVSADGFDALVVSGGWGATSYFHAYPGDAFSWGPIPAQAAEANRVIGEFLEQGKHVLGVCNGVNVLAWARVDDESPLKGRQVRAPWSSAFPQSYGGSTYTTSWTIDSVCPWNPDPGSDCFRMGRFATDNGALMPEVFTPDDRADAWAEDGLILTAQDNFAAQAAGRRLAALLTPELNACSTAQLECGASAHCSDLSGRAQCVCDAGTQDADGNGDCSATGTALAALAVALQEVQEDEDVDVALASVGGNNSTVTWTATGTRAGTTIAVVGSTLSYRGPPHGVGADFVEVTPWQHGIPGHPTTVLIDLAPVNDPPTLTVAPAFTLFTGRPTPPTTLVVSRHPGGGADEANQPVHITVSVAAGGALIDGAPTINADGSLAMTLAASGSGDIRLVLTPHDAAGAPGAPVERRFPVLDGTWQSPTDLTQLPPLQVNVSPNHSNSWIFANALLASESVLEAYPGLSPEVAASIAASVDVDDSNTPSHLPNGVQWTFLNTQYMADTSVDALGNVSRRFLHGVFVLTWQGDGDVSPISSVYGGALDVLRTEHTAGSHRMVFVTRTADQTPVVIVSRSAPEDPVRAVRLWVPVEDGAGVELEGTDNLDAGEIAGSTEPAPGEPEPLFHPAFLERLRELPDAGVLRVMDWISINGIFDPTPVSWADRASATSITRAISVVDANWQRYPLPGSAARLGMPYEWLVQLANALDRDLWIQVSHMATPDVAENLARLLADELEPGRRVFFEFSNEIWNSAEPYLPQRSAAEERAALHFNKEVDDLTMEELGYAAGRMAAESILAFESAWKLAGESDDRLVNVVAGFAISPEFNRGVLTGARDVSPGAAEAMAISNYFGGSGLQVEIYNEHAFGADPGVWPEELYAATERIVRRDLLDTAAAWASTSEVAAQFDVPLISYEGGQHITLLGFGITDPADPEVDAHRDYRAFMADFQRSESMGRLYREHFALWSSVGALMPSHYMDISAWDIGGYFGALERVNEADNPKWDALQWWGERQRGVRPWQQPLGSRPTITTTALEAEAGLATALPIEAIQGDGAVELSLLAGTLPEGLTLVPSISGEGTLTGTPTSPGRFEVVVRARDSDGDVDDARVTIVVAPEGRSTNAWVLFDPRALPLHSPSERYSTLLPDSSNGGAERCLPFQRETALFNALAVDDPLNLYGGAKVTALLEDGERSVDTHLVCSMSGEFVEVFGADNEGPSQVDAVLLWQRLQFEGNEDTAQFAFGSTPATSTLHLEIRHLVGDGDNRIRFVVINRELGADRWYLSEALWSDRFVGDGTFRASLFQDSNTPGQRWAPIDAPMSCGLELPEPETLTFGAAALTDVQAVGIWYQGSRWRYAYDFQFTRFMALGEVP